MLSASAQAATCGPFMRRLALRLSPPDEATAKERLVALGYSPRIAEKIAAEPALAREVLAQKSPPVKVFRGRTKDIFEWDPYKPQQAGATRPGNAVGKRDEMWIAKDMRVAIGYAMDQHNVSTGIVVEYEMPEFMLRRDASYEKTGNAQVNVDWMKWGEAPFVTRVAVMNGKRVPNQLASIDPAFFTEKWLPEPPRRSAPIDVGSFYP